jgi:hypothetical protein
MLVNQVPRALYSAGGTQADIVLVWGTAAVGAGNRETKTPRRVLVGPNSVLTLEDRRRKSK